MVDPKRAVSTHREWMVHLVSVGDGGKRLTTGQRVWEGTLIRGFSWREGRWEEHILTSPFPDAPEWAAVDSEMAGRLEGLRRAWMERGEFVSGL